jgi:hypothetical protein
MRDKRFIAEHRGGSLSKEHHRLLMIWACECVEHVLPLVDGILDNRLTFALIVGRNWAAGNASVGEARKASVEAHALARESSDPVVMSLARAAGHAVATAHMADHSLGPALYTLKAVKYAGKSTDQERQWQVERLPSEIRELVISGLHEKEKHFKL